MKGFIEYLLKFLQKQKFTEQWPSFVKQDPCQTERKLEKDVLLVTAKGLYCTKHPMQLRLFSDTVFSI